jgi:hypothetical protein
VVEAAFTKPVNVPQISMRCPVNRLLSLVVISAALALTGCGSGGRMDAQGYFYVTSTSEGYVVAQDIDTPLIRISDHGTVYVSKPTTIEQAQAICDRLNRALLPQVRLPRN